jgi:hypothetical protein
MLSPLKMPCEVLSFPEWEHFHSILVVYQTHSDERKSESPTEVGECFISMLDAVTELRYTRSESFFTPLVVRHARSLSCFGPRKSLNCLWRIVCVQARIDLFQSTRFPCDYAVCALHCEMVDDDLHFVQFSASMCCKVLVVCDVSVFYRCVYGAQADDYRSDSSVKEAAPEEVSYDHW